MYLVPSPLQSIYLAQASHLAVASYLFFQELDPWITECWRNGLAVFQCRVGSEGGAGQPPFIRINQWGR